MTTKAVSTRRHFFWKAGAALSAPLTVAAAQASEGARAGSEALKARVALLEGVNAIRELNRNYAKHVNAGASDEIAKLFADPAEAAVEGGVRSLSMGSAEQQDVIEISADHLTATARIHCTVQVEIPIEPTCPLVEMARQQGGGVLKRSESGVFANAYVKLGGAWKIQRWVYRSA